MKNMKTNLVQFLPLEYKHRREFISRMREKGAHVMWRRGRCFTDAGRKEIVAVSRIMNSPVAIARD